jgi:DHA1 family tetracycline resistance protein-like MFS transporter
VPALAGYAPGSTLAAWSRTVPVLFLIVFVDLLGFGILIPLFPYVAERLGASPFWVTFGGAGIYSLLQLVATPLWGRLSDAYGRKPILVVSTFGSALAYLAMAFAPTLPLLIAARAFQGLMAGNIAAAFAYATDVSAPENRARALGLIGAAFGLGFTVGPAVGGFLGGADKESMSFTGPMLVATGLSLLAFFGSLFLLRESLDPAHRHPFGARAADGGRRSLSPFAPVRGRPVLLGLVLVAVLVQVAATLQQSIYPLWANALYGFGPQQVGMTFFVLGLLAVSCQGGLAGPLSRRHGERALVAGGLTAYGLGLALLAVVHGTVSLYVGIALLGLGIGVYSPAISSLVSLQAEPHERGAVMGVYNAASSLGRIIGPTFAGPLYVAHRDGPFALAALLIAPAVFIVLRGTGAKPAAARGAVPPAG